MAFAGIGMVARGLHAYFGNLAAILIRRRLCRGCEIYCLATTAAHGKQRLLERMN